MRYDTKALFQYVTDDYDSIGDYTETAAEEHTEYVSIASTDIHTMHLVYGEIRQGSITMHLQGFVPYAFNRVVIDGKPYGVDQAFDLRFKKVYILPEWQA